MTRGKEREARRKKKEGRNSAKQMSGALPQGFGGEEGGKRAKGRHSVAIASPSRRCAHRKISRRRMGERTRRDAKLRKRSKRRKKGGRREKSTRKKEKTAVTKIGKETFSDEIRSRGRSEFGYLIREKERMGRRGGDDGRAKGGETTAPLPTPLKERGPPQVLRARLDILSLFSRIFLVSFSANSHRAALQIGLRGSRTSNGALFALPLPVCSRGSIAAPLPSGWDELTIDRIDTVAAGGPRVRRLETRVSPAARPVAALSFSREIASVPLFPALSSPVVVPAPAKHLRR